MDAETRLLDLIADRIADKVADRVLAKLAEDKKEYKHCGIEGIAQIFHCGHTKAQEIKNSHIIDEAIVYHGRKFLVDERTALACMARSIGH